MEALGLQWHPVSLGLSSSRILPAFLSLRYETLACTVSACPHPCPCLCLSRRPAMGWGRRGGQRRGGIGGARCGYTCKSKLISHLSDSDRSEILLHITTDDKIACKDLLVHPLSRLAPSCTSFLSLYISVSLSTSSAASNTIEFYKFFT